MTFANVGTIGVLPGQRDAVIEILTRRSEVLRDAGCVQYDVGVAADDADTVYVVELWQSEQAHRASLELAEVRAAIAEARPFLSGAFGGFRFDVVGSPLVET